LDLKENYKTDEKKTQTVGDRIRSLRGYLSLSRREFCFKHSIPEPTLRAWELSLTSITPRYLQKLLKAFEQENILCSFEWIMKGERTAPLFASEVISNELKEYEAQMTSSLENPILLESAVFQRRNPDSIVVNISDKSMLPLYEDGDYVGGLKVLLTSIQSGSSYIVVLPNGMQVVRVLHKGSSKSLFTLECSNPQAKSNMPTATNVEIKDVYRIVWHRKN
jgi:transcriptional regulator with XRE-family HTH domain